MFPKCIDCLGREKREPKQQQKKNKEKPKKKKQIKNGNNSTYHETLSEERIGRRS